MDASLLYFFPGLSGVNKLASGQVEEEDADVDEEGVPHHAEAESRPVVVAVIPEAEDGEEVGAHVDERHDCVEEPEEAQFDCHCKAKIQGSRIKFGTIPTTQQL